MPALMQHRPVEGPCWFTDTWQAPRPGGRVHEGLDIGADAGKPVYAVVDGRISKKYLDQPNWRGGNALRLTAADGTYYFYGHLSAFAEGIEAGVPVTAGMVIGFIGMTGNAGVNHLHFEIHPGGGKPIDPYPIAREAAICEQMGKPLPPQSSPSTTTAGGGAPATTVRSGGSTPSVPLLAGDGGPECVARYTVRSGDYWFFIAAATGIRPSTLAAANNRTIESFIYPDESLCVPDPSWRPSGAPRVGGGNGGTPSTTVKPGSSPTTPKPAPVANRTYKCASHYTVNPGDYWYMLAKWFQVRASTLAAANKRTIDDPIYPDEKLCIPA